MLKDLIGYRCKVWLTEGDHIDKQLGRYADIIDVDGYMIKMAIDYSPTASWYNTSIIKTIHVHSAMEGCEFVRYGVNKG